MVRGTYWRSGGGRGTHPVVRKWSVDPPGVPDVVGRSTRFSKRGCVTPAEVRKWSGHPPEGQEVVKRPSRKSKRGRENLLEVQNWYGNLPKVRKL